MKKLIIILTVVFIIVTALTCTVSCTVLLINSGPSEGAEWTSPTTGMEFVWIEALDCWVGKYEVTNGEYREKEPDHDSKDYEGHSLNGDRQPVVFVNYSDAQQYAKWLTEKDREVLGGAEYRLPTRDEWMTFAQCGDGRKYPWGDNWPPPSGRAGNYHDQAGAGTWSKIDGYRDGHAVTCIKPRGLSLWSV